MTMPALPAQGSTNWYAHYSALHDKASTAATTAAGNVFTGDQRINGGLGVNSSPTNRVPWNTLQILTGTGASTPGTSDVVGHGMQTVVQGNYTGIGGSNPGYAWGLNVFTTTGSAAGDGAGLVELMGGLFEVDVQTPAGTTIPTVIGAMAEAAFFGATAGATVTSMMSLRVGAPKRKDGATAGTATNAYGLFVEGVAPAAVGATTAYSVYVESGTSRLGGLLELATNAYSTANVFDLWAGGASSTGGARLQLRANGVDGYAYVHLPQSGARLIVGDGTTPGMELRNTGEIVSKRITATATTTGSSALMANMIAGQTADIVAVRDFNTNTMWAVNAVGIPRWTASANQQATVGAAGGASPPPATPAQWLKVIDSAGTTLVIPAYLAA